MYLGDIVLGDTIDHKFTTTDTSGVPTTLAGTPVVSAYVGNGTTEITAGITLSVDFDSRTGMHNVRVVASGGNGFAAQTNVQLVITTGTVGGSSVVGYVIGSFSIENRSALRPTVAGRTLDTTSAGNAGIDWGNIDNPTSSVGLTNTTVGIVTLLNGIAANVISAASIAAAAGSKIADIVLRRTYANARVSSDGDAVNFRSLLGSVGKMVNKWTIVAGVLTIFQEDDTTSTAPGGTQNVTGTAGADPITTIDTV